VRDGDLVGAREAYRKAVEVARSPSRAGLSLGRLLRREGDLDGARDAYRIAVAVGDNDIAPRAALALGVVLQELGADRKELIAAYRTAQTSPDVVVKTAAAEALERLERQVTA
jgi:Flp pilus assembly protein TadD